MGGAYLIPRRRRRVHGVHVVREAVAEVGFGRKLGLHYDAPVGEGITRRDFLDGMALAIVAGMAPADLLAATATDVRYPPALTGLRGQHDGGFEAAHAQAFDRREYLLGGLPVESQFDCIVVGAGISGLAAAWFYRQRFGRDARILVLDNHDEFGGHARRNEFTVGDRLLIGYGGSESLQSPAAKFSPVVNTLLAALGVDIERFGRYFDQSLYPGLGLSRGSFFDRDRFGRDRLVSGDPTDWVCDDIPRHGRNGRPIERFIADFPVSELARRQLLELYATPRVTLDRFTSGTAREAYLARTSYTRFLRDDWGLGDDAIAYFAGRPLDFFGLPPNLISAIDASRFAYPGFAGISLPKYATMDELTEPYIYHFPDGNASIARLLVRSLVPSAIPGSTMEDIVLARARYEELDRPSHRIRIRLDSTVVRVANGAAGVEVGYLDNRSRALHRLRARHVVMACFNSLIPYVLAGLPDAQASALRRNVKSPLVYTKVLVSNWRPWVQLGVHEIYGVASHHSRVKLDYPVTMGGYHHPERADEPMVLHLVHVPTVPGIDEPRAALRASRALLLQKTFADYEDAVRRDLSRMLGPGGFDDRRDILAITVNRWSHGYAWGGNSLLDGDEDDADTMRRARRPVGRVTIANSDAGWSAYAHAAVDQAHRAVGEL
jgi:spermidine dehydrogenase